MLISVAEILMFFYQYILVLWTQAPNVLNARSMKSIKFELCKPLTMKIAMKKTVNVIMKMVNS